MHQRLAALRKPKPCDITALVVVAGDNPTVNHPAIRSPDSIGACHRKRVAFRRISSGVIEVDGSGISVAKGKSLEKLHIVFEVVGRLRGGYFEIAFLVVGKLRHTGDL